MYIEVNTLKLCVEELKENNVDSRRKDARNSVQIDELQKNMKKIQNQINEDNENYEKQFKDIKMQLLGGNGPKPGTPPDSESLKKSKKTIEK